MYKYDMQNNRLLSSLLKHKIFANIFELIRYGFFGFITTCLNFILFIMLTYTGMNYLVSNTIAYVIAVIINYFFNQKYVFSGVGKYSIDKYKQFSSFFFMRLVSWVVDTALFYSLVDIFQFDVYISRIALSIVIIYITFIVNKYIIFKRGDI